MICIKDNMLIISQPNAAYNALHEAGMYWDKRTKTLRSPINVEILDRVCSIFGTLPKELEEYRIRMHSKQFTIDALRNDPDPIPIAEYPVKIPLYRHQIRGANMAMKVFDGYSPTGRGFGFLFEMGCGKTLTSIAVVGALYRQGKIKRLLIVAPTSVCSVWPKEFDSFADFPYKTALLLGNKKDRLAALKQLQYTPFGGLKIAIINYESTYREGNEQALAAFQADMVIADESQRIKTHNAKQSKEMHKLGDKAAYKLMLSGTPVQNNVVDLYSQYRFLNPDVFGKNFYVFKNRYCVMGGYENKQIVGYRYMDELIKKAHSISYRVTKDECLDLPDQTFEDRYVTFDSRQRKIYNQLKKQGLAELEFGEVSASTVLTKLLRLQQLTGGFLTTESSDKPEAVNTAKLDALEDILKDYVLESGQKLVIFARFRSEIFAIMDLMRKLHIPYGCIYGDIPIDERGGIVDDFQNNPETKVFLAQLQTAGLGITLHSASTAVFYSLDFNYANYAQALARIHRIGQRKPVTYIHLLVEDSIDEKTLEALQRKEDIAKLICDNWRQYFD